ncbi:MAG TPA: SpoIIE family protein phosphatase [Candidatus Acidoferrales bacterium]|nr:SpoIIE family protein phosphatase [Candidatus Acidoferrales bacterium]
MRQLRHNADLDANVRGALTLGAMLTFILAVALLGAFRIYDQLDEAARVERILVLAQQQVSAVERAQLDEETGLRGFLATGQRSFLDPFLAAADTFDQRADRVGDTLAPLGIAEVGPLIGEMKMLHNSWEQNVARPLLNAPHSAEAPSRETLGKVLVDQLRSDSSHLSRLLDQRLLLAQNDLRERINETLGGAVASIVLFGVLGIIYVGSRTRMLARIGRERAIIETLQRVFRTGWDPPPGARVGTAYISATADAGVGGDLFDIRRLTPTSGLLVVADVSGKGIDAAVNTAFVKYSIRMLARHEDDPSHILSEFNAVFIETIKDPNLFVTVFVGIVDIATMRLRYASAGHGGAFLRSGSGVRQLPVTGPVIGLDPSMTFEVESLSLTPTDVLVLVTDGLTEARDPKGEQLDDEGAMRLIAEAPTEPQECADFLVASVRAHSGGTLTDDLALLVVSFSAPAAEANAA